MSHFFVDTFEQDNRQPLFEVPWVIEGHKLAFFGFDYLFWLYSFALLTVQACVNLIIAIVIYYGIVQPKRSKKGRGGRTIHWFPYLLGYGGVIPLLLVLPFWLIEWLDLRNVAFILCVGGSNPAMLLFRCIEAMHGTLPSYLFQASGNDKDDQVAPLGQFVAYYASSIQFELDQQSGKPIPFTLSQAKRVILKFVSVFLQTTLCYSILLSCNYRVFPNRHEQLSDLFFWGNILNNFLMASLTSLCLECTYFSQRPQVSFHSFDVSHFLCHFNCSWSNRTGIHHVYTCRDQNHGLCRCSFDEI